MSGVFIYCNSGKLLDITEKTVYNIVSMNKSYYMKNIVLFVENLLIIFDNLLRKGIVMNLFIKKIAALSVSAAMLGIAVSASDISSGITNAAPDELHDDWLHVNENAEIVDMNGNPVWLTGCNWFGYNVGSQVFDGVWSQNMHKMLNEIADHGFNLLRVPMSTEILLQWKNNEPDTMIKINEYENPELTVEGIQGGTPMYSFDIWNKAVEWCRENGIKIMIDIHSATTASSGHQVPLWYDSKFSTEDWIEALSWFADYYKDDDTIIAIDLKNEPHGKNDGQGMAIWDDSTKENNWKYAAETCAAAVLGKNPYLLIMVEGIEVYPKFEIGSTWDSPAVDYAHYGDESMQPFYGAWWGGNFRGAKDYPVDFGEYQSQLVYSPHDYGPLVYAQTWFDKDFTRQTLLDDYWYDTWAYLVEENISPLLMGEWGGFIDEQHDPTGDNKKWMEILRDYMIEKRIHHTFWCFNENSGDTGGLVYDNFGKWDKEKYAFVEPSLWQDENGKFISLDHKIKLGQSGNGISLSDYYSGTSQPSSESKTEPSEISTAGITAETTGKETVSGSEEYIAGDANVDGIISVSDATLILQFLGNSDKYTLTKQGKINADVDGESGISVIDALRIQEYDAKQIPSLPVIN